jgi:hypothetical protein
MNIAATKTYFAQNDPPRPKAWCLTAMIAAGRIDSSVGFGLQKRRVVECPDDRLDVVGRNPGGSKGQACPYKRISCRRRHVGPDGRAADHIRRSGAPSSAGPASVSRGLGRGPWHLLHGVSRNRTLRDLGNSEAKAHSPALSAGGLHTEEPALWANVSCKRMGDFAGKRSVQW